MSHNIWAYDGQGNRGSREDEIMRHFMVCTHQIFGDQIKKNEMGGACSTYGDEER